MLITTVGIQAPSALTFGQIVEIKAIHPLVFTQSVASTGHKPEVVSNQRFHLEYMKWNKALDGEAKCFFF